MWSAKGGSGTSVVSAALAVVAARSRPTLLVDFGRDQPAVLGMGSDAVVEPASHAEPPAEPHGVAEASVGLVDWLAAPSPPPDALARLEVPAGPGLSLLPTGRLVGDGHPDGPGDPGDGRRAERLDVLGRLLAADRRAVVVDVGAASHRYEPVLARAAASILVTRACYLALRRPIPARHVDRVVLVAEPGRALRRRDVETALPAPVSATVEWDPAVARAVDAGTIRRRLPRSLRALEVLLADLPSGSDGSLASVRSARKLGR
ncbi:MAG: hypothetical protein ACR2QO_01520 [Acidimicrobiales bacterium]